MSMQQINLYLPELQPKKVSFSLSFCVAASLFSLIALFAIQYIANTSLVELKANVETLENQRVATGERLSKIKSKALSSSAFILDKRIIELRKQIQDRQTVEKIIEWQNLGNEEGFALVMEGLARHSNNKFSLEKIRLSAGGKTLELAGETRNAEEIPLYLQALQSEKSLANTRFGLLSMGVEKSVKKFSLGFETVYKLAGEK